MNMEKCGERIYQSGKTRRRNQNKKRNLGRAREVLKTGTLPNPNFVLVEDISNKRIVNDLFQTQQSFSLLKKVRHKVRTPFLSIPCNAYAQRTTLLRTQDKHIGEIMKKYFLHLIAFASCIFVKSN